MSGNRPACQPADGGSGTAPRPLVLIAEDEPNIVESLTFLVERAGLAPVAAADAALALQAIRGLRPAVVILDLMLPDASGLEVLKAVKGNPDYKDIPVLVLTACGRDSDRDQALALGADAYVTKPFSNRELMAEVCRLAGAESRGREGGSGP